MEKNHQRRPAGLTPRVFGSGEVEALLPVVGMLLQFSPEEVNFDALPFFSFLFLREPQASSAVSQPVSQAPSNPSPEASSSVSGWPMS